MPAPTAAQVLYVLYGCEDIDLDALTFCVITGGYMHDLRGEKFPAGSEPNYWPFERGEVMVLNDWGREPFGEGRKPSKWSVVTFETKDFDAAVALADTLKQDPKVEPGLWEWSDGVWVRPYDQDELRQRRRRDRGAMIALVGGEN